AAASSPQAAPEPGQRRALRQRQYARSPGWPLRGAEVADAAARYPLQKRARVNDSKREGLPLNQSLSTGGPRPDGGGTAASRSSGAPRRRPVRSYSAEMPLSA